MGTRKNINNAALERALDLKMGSWDTDKSPEMKALKKIVETFPWIVEVADRSYDKEYADAAHFKAAVETLDTDGIAEILKGLREDD